MGGHGSAVDRGQVRPGHVPGGRPNAEGAGTTQMRSAGFGAMGLAALGAAGMTPIAALRGSAVMAHGCGLRSGAGGGSGELDLLAQAVAQGYVLALGRLRRAAAQIGADGVVDVRLRRTEGAQGLWGEYVAAGTAVAVPGLRADEPFTATLSPRDCARLAGTGVRPLAVVVGVSVYYAFAGYQTGLISASPVNREYPAFTEAATRARQLAQRRMESAARGADGVVDVRLEVRLYEGGVAGQPIGGGEDRTIQAVVIGTAVRGRGAVRPGGPRPLVVSLGR